MMFYYNINISDSANQGTIAEIWYMKYKTQKRNPGMNPEVPFPYPDAVLLYLPQLRLHPQDTCNLQHKTP